MYRTHLWALLICNLAPAAAQVAPPYVAAPLLAGPQAELRASSPRK